MNTAMLDALLLHYRTKRQVDSFVSNPSHALILVGPKGSGKQTLARSIAASILETEELEKYAYYSEINPKEQVIPIDSIRELQKLLVLKTPSAKNKSIRRVISVIDAERMPHEAQNAFLKSLEEPPEDTCIILTVESSSGLLPTIYSRAQQIEILPVSETQAKEFFDASKSSFAASYALSQGQVGLLSALLNEDEHELRQWVTKGKKLLSMNAADRLIEVDSLSKDKNDIRMLLNALQRIAHAGLVNAAAATKEVNLKHWQSVMQSLQASFKGLAANANTKLLLDNLLLGL